MVDRDEVEAEVTENVNIIRAGKWYIAEGLYDGREYASQGESRAEAIDKLVSKFYKRLKREEQNEKEQHRLENKVERDRERAAEHTERVKEALETDIHHTE